jgi:mono/diheme cytochrome c family protein
MRPPISGALRWLIGWVLGGFTALIAAIAIALFVIFSGAFDVTASTPHHPLVAWATHTTMKHSVRARAKGRAAPKAFTAAQVAAGFNEYDQHCAACHGGPGLSRAVWASAISPTPPYLLDAARRWSPAELEFIVHNGVKMTAMPAWGEVERDDQIWNLVAFLEALPRLSAADYANMRASVTPSAPLLEGARSPPITAALAATDR